MTSNQFESILETVRNDLLSRHTLGQINLTTIKDTDFEGLFAHTLSKKLNGALTVDYREGSTIFPDIGCAPYGVEIKTAKADKWICLGNSIMEGTRRDRVEIIYVAFLKKGGIPDIRIRPYDASISDIKVTHSPRYEINMDISYNQTIFSKLEIPYSEFKDASNKIQRLRRYYQDNGVDSWWLDEETGETVTTMNLISFGTLPTERKHELLTEIFALFPEILKKQYGQAASYLVMKYGIFNPSFRDMVTAGGRETMLLNGSSINVSRSVFNLISLIPSIIDFINNKPELVTQQRGIQNDGHLAEYWFQLCEEYIYEMRLIEPLISLRTIYDAAINGTLLRG